jgi:fructokinase
MKLGIDLGGTKIECVVLSDENQIIHKERTATPKGDYDATLNAIAKLVQAASPLISSSTPVGVGIPGTLSSDTGTIKNANSTCLIGQALDKDLSDLLDRKVTLANDANCFIWSEFCDGAAKGTKNAFGVIIGTGVGGGLVMNGQLVNGLNGIAGEWGHNPLPYHPSLNHQSLDCYCGKKDCIETYLSGPAFELKFQQFIENTSCDKSLKTKPNLSAKEIVARANSGDHQALAHLDSYAKMLAASLTGVINIVDPDVIVLGGGMSNIDALYELVPKYLKEFVFSDTIHTPIVRAKYGDSSGVRGAAWL